MISIIVIQKVHENDNRAISILSKCAAL